MTTKVITVPKQPLTWLGSALPWLLIICGTIGLIASLIITNDKFILAGNPGFQPGCDLNPIISCGSVMKTEQSHVFGFMNTYIGLVGFPVLITTGVAMLAGITRLKRWYWLGMQAGLSLGMVFAYWLLWQSMYRIGALCPWCLTVDVVLTIVWWYVTLFNFYTGNLRTPERLRPLGRFIKRHHADIVVFWLVIVTALILQHFWYYFGQHI